MPSFPIHIHGIYIAPQHKVFGHQDPDDLSGADLKSLETANLIAHSGIEGDRFCRNRPDYNGHITFFSLEVWNEVKTSLKLPDTVGPEVARRNVIISGIDLKALYEQAFEIQGIQFQGKVHCSPCAAMNQALAAGARAALRSRGGLRAQILSSGELKSGVSQLTSEADCSPANAATQLKLPNIP
ncbi:MAG: molybdenum cofactor biosysynthesis protein [Verrucomicrobiota bacterium]